MGLFRGQSLSRRILVPVLPSILLATSYMGVFSYLLVRREIVSNTEKTMRYEAEKTARRIEDFFLQRKNDMESLSETPLIADYNKNLGFGLSQEADVYLRELEKYFSNFAGRNRLNSEKDVYYNISYVNARGKLICSIRKQLSARAFQASLEPEFIEILRGKKYFDPPVQRMFDVEGSIPIKRYAKAVFDDTSVFLGAIVTDTDLRNVEEMLHESRAISPNVRAYVVDRRGEHVLGEKETFRHPLEEWGTVSGGNGEDKSQWQWKVFVTAPAEDFLDKPLKEIFTWTLLLSILACLLLMAVIVLRVSDLMRPIQAMVEGTRRFATGDLTYRFPQLSSKELDILAQSFNQMAGTLETRNRELEQRIRQLTALRDMEEAVIQRQDEETVLRTCLEAVARGFSFDRTAMYWVDQSHKEIVGRYLFGSETMGFTETAFRKRRVALGSEDILNEVVRTRNALIVDASADDTRLNPSFVTEAKTRQFVMAPICGKERVLGIITADNYFTGRPLKESDREGLMLYANAVGLALENSMLFQNLAESESRLRTVLENSPEAIVGLSREHWIGTWNRGAEKIFGFKAPEVLGKPLTVLFPKNAGGEFKQLLNNVMEKGAVRDFSMPGQAKDGRALDLSVSWGGAHQDFWMNKEWTLVIRDITEARRLQQQLIRSEKLSAVGQLISGIAHELNNPLQAVVGYSDILTDDMRTKVEESAEKPVELNPKEVLSDLRIITENAMRCQKIIENLLLFVRQGEIEKKPVDIEKVIQASRDLLQYKLKKAANVLVEVEISTGLPRAKGNFQQIQQVFVNLINNACDAMSTTAGPKRIRLAARENQGFIHVEIGDSGPGIPAEVRDRLFEPFFTTKAEGRGTGLGLAVCRQIIEDHGGRISFTTEVGNGTTFAFDLQVAREESAFAPSAAPALPPVKGKNVLVVDDEPDVLGFLSKVVQSEGDVVELASSLKEAIGKVTQKAFDLVVTDVRLGEGTGINLFENWNLWTHHPRPAFLFLTGDVVNSTLAQEIEKKGLQLIHKPIDLASFQITLRTLLSARR